MNFKQELQALLKSGHLFINVVTCEEERVEYIIKTLYDDNVVYTIYYWDFIDGYKGNPQLEGLAKQNPIQALELIEKQDNTLDKKQIFILRDFASFLQDISVVRKIRNISRKLRHINCHILLISSEIFSMHLLKDILTVVEAPLPNLKEIQMELTRLMSFTKWDGHSFSLNKLAFACKGLSMQRIRRLMSKIAASAFSDNEIRTLVFQEKQQFIKQVDILEYCISSYSSGLDEIGGLNILKAWLRKRSLSFSKKAFNYGIPAPKGVLLTGIQGTGKSLVAKSLSAEWNMPLLKLDVGKLFAGVVGKSEEKIRTMIQVAEASAPCILWIDEIDKAFTGVTNSYGDSGTSSRVFLTFINWLAEKNSFVFIVSTANNIADLPSEILRKGRFDEIFFVDLPDFLERKCIFRIHLMKMRPLTWFNYDINLLSKISLNFSGAEIKQVIVEAMHDAFYEEREFNTKDIINVIDEFVPLYLTHQSSIATLQQWAESGRIRLASDHLD